MLDLTLALLQQFQPKERKLGRFNASDVWAIANGYLTAEEFFNPEKINIISAYKMWQGRWKHSQFQELLGQMGYQCELKKEHTEPRWILVGKVDAINSEQILEIKTSEEILHKSKRWHDYQLKLYLTMFERPFGWIVQPIIKDNRLLLKHLSKVERDDDWFNEQMRILEIFFQKLIKIKL